MQKLYIGGVILFLILNMIVNVIYGQKNSFSFEEIRNAKKITDYESHYFKNEDSLNIKYYSFSVEDPTAKIIFIHGGGAYSNLGYFNLADDLRKKYNIQTILIDLVGHGNSEGK